MSKSQPSLVGSRGERRQAGAGAGGNLDGAAACCSNARLFCHHSVPQKEGPGTQAVEGFCRATEQLQRLPTEVLCGEEPQLVHRLDLKAIGGLEVVGHRLRGQYPLLSREQLEKDLRSDSIIQNALAKQQALLKVRESTGVSVLTWSPAGHLVSLHH